MVVINNILALPFMVILWAMDALVFVVALQMVLDGLVGFRAPSLVRCLREITDPLKQSIRRCVVKFRGEPWPDWAIWLLAIVGILLLRQAALAVLMAMQ